MGHLPVHANHYRVVQQSKCHQNGRGTAQILRIECGPQIILPQNDNWVRIPRHVASSAIRSRISVHF